MRKIPVFIYTLKDPTTMKVVYVGRTMCVSSRYSTHIHSFTSTDVSRWVRSVVSSGKQICMEVVEECTNIDGAEREEYWINHYGGVDNLLNMTSKEVSRKKMIQRLEAKRQAWTLST